MAWNVFFSHNVYAAYVVSNHTMKVDIYNADSTQVRLYTEVHDYVPLRLSKNLSSEILQ